MNRLQATAAQVTAVSRLNVQLDAEKLMKRIYREHKPAASANEDVNNWIVGKNFGYRKHGEPLLRLTEIGRRYVREVLL